MMQCMTVGKNNDGSLVFSGSHSWQAQRPHFGKYDTTQVITKYINPLRDKLTKRTLFDPLKKKKEKKEKKSL